jgi:hypothetical protein
VLLPEDGDHSERILGDTVPVPSTALFGLRHQTPALHQQPKLSRDYENIVTVPLGSGVLDDCGVTFSSLIRRLPALPEYYRGRNLAVHRVVRVFFQCFPQGCRVDCHGHPIAQIQDVLERRLVCVCGPEGIGKSVVVVAVAHYLSLRKRFPSGVYFAHLTVRELARLH